MNVCPPLIANAHPSELVQPGQGLLNHPPINSQPAPMLSEAFGKDGPNPKQVQRLPMWLRVISTVSLNSIRLVVRPASLATNRKNGLHQGQQLGHIMTVSSGQNGCQGCPISVRNHMMLTPAFASVSGTGPVSPPPPTARMEALSTTAPDQSI